MSTVRGPTPPARGPAVSGSPGPAPGRGRGRAGLERHSPSSGHGVSISSCHTGHRLGPRGSRAGRRPSVVGVTSVDKRCVRSRQSPRHCRRRRPGTSILGRRGRALGPLPVGRSGTPDRPPTGAQDSALGFNGDTDAPMIEHAEAEVAARRCTHAPGHRRPARPLGGDGLLGHGCHRRRDRSSRDAGSGRSGMPDVPV